MDTRRKGPPARIWAVFEPMEPRFTVLLPVVRLPAMLPFAIETVLEQTLADFELFIITDGAPEATVACAQGYVESDPRVRLFTFPKGAHTGMEHRHTALASARGRFVAHIGDDDLWFPDHLEEMERLLSRVDFGHTINVHVLPDGALETLASDLADPQVRRRQIAATFSQFAEAVTGYRLEAYRRLPEGWTGVRIPYPDLHVWRKFLTREDIGCGTAMAVTALVFASEDPGRENMSLEDRGEENRRWQMRLRSPEECKKIKEDAWRTLMRDFLNQQDDRLARHHVIVSLQEEIRTLKQLLERLHFDGLIDFSAVGNSEAFIVSGWSGQERDMRWTDGSAAALRVQLASSSETGTRDVSLIHLRARAFGKPQRVRVLVNGTTVDELTVGCGWNDYEMAMPPSTFRADTENEVKFLTPDAHAPISVGFSEDTRTLGIAVMSIAFRPAAKRRWPWTRTKR